MNAKLLNRFLDDTAFMLGSMGDILMYRVFGDGPMAAEPPWRQEAREQLKPKMAIENGVAHIPVEGVLAFAPDVMEMAYEGVEDTRNIVQMLQDARLNTAVKGVQLNINSPGGFFMGGMEVGDAVAALNRVKPVEAYIGGLGASMAYLIASQAGHITASRASRVGSIGAYQVVTDMSRRAEQAGIKVQVFTNKEATFKAAGMPGTSLRDAQAAHIQEQTQAAFDEFKGQILQARPGIPADAMRGQVFTGKEATRCGLVDMVGDRAAATMYLKGRMG